MLFPVPKPGIRNSEIAHLLLQACEALRNVVSIHHEHDHTPKSPFALVQRSSHLRQGARIRDRYVIIKSRPRVRAVGVPNRCSNSSTSFQSNLRQESISSTCGNLRAKTVW